MCGAHRRPARRAPPGGGGGSGGGAGGGARIVEPGGSNGNSGRASPLSLPPVHAPATQSCTSGASVTSPPVPAPGPVPVDRPSNGGAGVYRDDHALVGASGVDECQPPEGTLLHVVVHSAQHLPKRDGERLTADPWDDGTFATWEVGPGREQKQRFDEEVMTGGDVIQASVELSVVGGYVSEHDDPSVPYVTYEWERARPLASHTSAVDLESNRLLPVWAARRVGGGAGAPCCVAWNPDFAFLRLVVYRQRASRPGGGRRPIGCESSRWCLQGASARSACARRRAARASRLRHARRDPQTEMQPRALDGDATGSHCCT